MKHSKAIVTVTILAILCLWLKIYFIIKGNPHLYFFDEQRNYEIAQNYVAGKGYGIYDNTVHRYRLTAFHSSSTVFLYQFLLQNHVPKSNIAISFYIISTILYVLAVLYFYRILRFLGISESLTLAAVLTFVLYPSVMYSMGPKYHFDNLVMPLHIINFYYLLRWIKHDPPGKFQRIFLIGSISFCCFFRLQTILIYFLAGCVMLLAFARRLVNKKRPDNGIPYFFGLLALTLAIVFVPVLKKNKEMFGSYIVSTQAGFEFLQGHNSINRGNWILPGTGNGLDNYVHAKMPFIDTLDEYSESKVRTHLAWEWIKENPGMETKYIFKKMARYFVPEQSKSLTLVPMFRYHPLAIMVHLFFLISILIAFFKHREFLFSDEMLLLLAPVIATLLLSVIFFFDMKLRYHAEPFMIIIDALAVDRYLKSVKFSRLRAHEGHESVG